MVLQSAKTKEKQAKSRKHITNDINRMIMNDNKT